MSAKDYILQALLELLHEQNFEEITVKQIVKKAGISRSTFYLHFEDKYQLMDNLRKDITAIFLANYDMKNIIDKPPIQKITLQICQHTYEYRDFYKQELNSPAYSKLLSELLKEKFIENFKDKGYATFASYGTIGYLANWVQDDFKMTPEEAAEELARIGMTDWSR
ncbi:TetR/AcrR family transcriptional regulator [Oceanobacillus sp. CAU 1775]